VIRRPDREALTTRGGSGGQRSASSRVACAAARGQAYGVNHCFIGNSARLYTKHGPNLSVRHRTRRGRSSQRRSACPNPRAASEAAGGSWQQLTQRRRDSGGRVDACADICRAARRAAHRCSRGGVTRLGSGCRRPAGGGGAPARRSCGAGAAATASARAVAGDTALGSRAGGAEASRRSRRRVVQWCLCGNKGSAAAAGEPDGLKASWVVACVTSSRNFEPGVRQRRQRRAPRRRGLRRAPRFLVLAASNARRRPQPCMSGSSHAQEPPSAPRSAPTFLAAREGGTRPGFALPRTLLSYGVRCGYLPAGCARQQRRAAHARARCGRRCSRRGVEERDVPRRAREPHAGGAS
jgi:hypothetical protein